MTYRNEEKRKEKIEKVCQIVSSREIVEIIKSPEYAETILSPELKGNLTKTKDYFWQTQIDYNGE